jgi:hypothetical protein
LTVTKSESVEAAAETCPEMPTSFLTSATIGLDFSRRSRFWVVRLALPEEKPASASLARIRSSVEAVYSFGRDV